MEALIQVLNDMKKALIEMQEDIALCDLKVSNVEKLIKKKSAETEKPQRIEGKYTKKNKKITAAVIK